MIIIGIILIFLAFIYVGLPLWAKLIVYIINFFVPDPIPIVDEVFMLASIFADIIKIFKVMKIFNWMRTHKMLALCIGIGTIILLWMGASLLFSHIQPVN